ncbi:hypothetical protein [Micromonospora lutea]|uniref:Type II CBASS E2 protein domain-containing protein n=1 Tax=Micromonospora lutea TaxID=419825 RepID=A0ABQ4IYI9_9ACTN|nr:hypothetical protein [Micromonospora lutea]GIJ22850.1 hypothetical protein Vlu01_34740 [Micromonospora lutea]
MVSIPTRAVNLTRQLVAITTVLPDAEGAVRGGELTCTVRLQPSPASRTYTVHLTYRHGLRPKVTVIDPPVLELHPDAEALPHVYAGDELCLYYPGEWKHHMLLVTTILPWTTEWLLYYELWLIIGYWAGGGDTHATGEAVHYRPNRGA